MQLIKRRQENDKTARKAVGEVELIVGTNLGFQNLAAAFGIFLSDVGLEEQLNGKQFFFLFF